MSRMQLALRRPRGEPPPTPQDPRLQGPLARQPAGVGVGTSGKHHRSPPHQAVQLGSARARPSHHNPPHNPAAAFLGTGRGVLLMAALIHLPRTTPEQTRTFLLRLASSSPKRWRFGRASASEELRRRRHRSAAADIPPAVQAHTPRAEAKRKAAKREDKL